MCVQQCHEYINFLCCQGKWQQLNEAQRGAAVSVPLPGQSHITPNNKVYSVYIWHGDRDTLVWGVLFILTQGSPPSGSAGIQPPATAIRGTHLLCGWGTVWVDGICCTSLSCYFFFFFLVNFSAEGANRKSQEYVVSVLCLRCPGHQ